MTNQNGNKNKQDNKNDNKERNERMIHDLLASGYANERIADAMRHVRREHFVPENEREHSYADYPLPIGFGQTMSAPSVIGMMLMLADIQKGMKILEVGTGSGWLTALAAYLVGDEGKTNGGKVTTVEQYVALSEIAKERMGKIGLTNVNFIVGDGSCGWKEFSPYGRIIITGGMPAIPDEMKEQLADDGVIVAPLGSKYYQDLAVYRKRTNTIDYAMPVLFVPVIGKCGFKEM